MNKLFSRKYILNALFVLCFTFGFTLLTHVNASAATDSTGARQTAATATSITLNWNPVSDATGYIVQYNPYYDDSSTPLEVSTTDTTIVMNGLSQNTKYSFLVKYSVAGDDYYHWLDSCTASTMPTKVSEVGIAYYWSSLKEVKLVWTENEGADGYQIQLYNNKNKKVKTYTENGSYKNYDYLYKIAQDKFYKVKVRAYILINGKKTYGAYSNWYYFSQQPEVDLDRASNGMKVSWNKIEGATGYTVYASTKRKSGYKKVGNTTKTSLTAKKCGSSKLKKGKRYYFYVVANKKVGSKTYKSGTVYCWSMKY